jgi:hypothetical protein
VSREWDQGHRCASGRGGTECRACPVGEHRISGGGRVIDSNGMATASLDDSGVLGAVVGTAGYLTGIALLGLAVGTLLRSTAVAISTLFGVVFLLPGSRAAPTRELEGPRPDVSALHCRSGRHRRSSCGRDAEHGRRHRCLPRLDSCAARSCRALAQTAQRLADTAPPLPLRSSGARRRLDLDAEVGCTDKIPGAGRLPAEPATARRAHGSRINPTGAGRM